MKKISVIQTWTETNHPMRMTAHHLQKVVFLSIAKELLNKSWIYVIRSTTMNALAINSLMKLNVIW